VLGSRKPSWGHVALVSACLVLVILSETRTAGIAMILSVGLATVTVSVFARRRVRSLLPGLASRRISLILGVALIGVLFTAPNLWAALETYLDKRSESTSLAEAYGVSRGALIEAMFENIEAHFWTGIGFGIASQPAEMIVERDPILNLPIGAAIEKGVLPIAVLEELGAFGLLAAGLWLWMVMRRAARGGVVSLAVLLCALLLNLGENLMFSPGGMGLLLLILIAWSANARNDQQRGPDYA
jgi:O-antigen ligase